MEQNVMSFIPTNCFSDVNIERLNTHERKAIVALAKAVLEKDFLPGKSFKKPEDAMDYLQLKYMDYEHEVFSGLFLNSRHRMIKYEILYEGTIDGVSVYPREIVKKALKHNASAIILAHNHPSGEPKPSSADVSITKRLSDALDLVEVRVLDHIVVGKEGIVSMAEAGLM